MTLPARATRTDLAVGIVVHYLPDPARPGPRPTGESVATVQSDGSLLDAFSEFGRNAPGHRLTETEAATVVVLLDLNDYEEIDGCGAFAAWSTYDPEDRTRLTSQHGLKVRWFVRKGAEPRRAEMIALAQAAVEQAAVHANAAEERLTRARADLATLTRLQVVPEPSTGSAA